MFHLWERACPDKNVPTHMLTHTSTYCTHTYTHTYKDTKEFNKGVWEMSAESEKQCNLIIIIRIVIACQGLRGIFALLDTWLICEQIIVRHPWRLLFKLHRSVPHRIPNLGIIYMKKASFSTLSFQKVLFTHPLKTFSGFTIKRTRTYLTHHWQLMVHKWIM